MFSLYPLDLRVAFYNREVLSNSSESQDKSAAGTKKIPSMWEIKPRETAEVRTDQET